MTSMLEQTPTHADVTGPPSDGNPEHQPRKFRPDIEGLRAIAVLLVVLYHAKLLGISGGYVGVDVFFVISGFLITRQLISGVARRGVAELPSFYARRIRRLLPASCLVVCSTITAAWFWAGPTQARATFTDAIFTSFYGLNYRLAFNGTQYLHQGDAVSPLQHFWSLGVEEQFYVVWPLLIIAALLLPTRVRLIALTSLLAGIFAVSLGYSITTTATNSSWAYFSLHTRAWELAAGGLIALGAPACARLPRLVTNLGAWGGCAVIIASAWLLNDATIYPGSAAMIPVFATAVVIGCGCPSRYHSIERVFVEPAIQGIGKVSYGWYLWHWPMLVLLPLMAGESLNWVRRLEIVLLSLLFAILTYHFLENPARKMRRTNFEWVRTGMVLAAIAVGAALVADNILPDTGSGAVVQAKVFDPSSPKLLQQYSKAINAGLISLKAPRNLTPKPLHAAKDVSITYKDGCHADFTAPIHPPACIFGDPKGAKTAVLIGDSHGEQWFAGLNVAAKRRHWKLINWTRSACPTAQITVFAQQLNRTYTECDEYRAATTARIKAMHPDLVINSQSDDVVSGATSPAQWAALTTQTLKQYRAVGIPVTYILDTPYPRKDVADCVGAHLNSLQQCTFTLAGAYTYPARRKALTTAVEAIGGKVVNPEKWLCGEATCPAVVANILVWRDKSHMTTVYSKWLAPLEASMLPATKHPAPRSTND